MINVVCYILLMVSYAVDPYTMIDASYQILKPKYEKKLYYFGACGGLYGLILIKQVATFCGKSLIPMLIFPAMFVYIVIITQILFQGNLREKILLFFELYLLSCIIDAVAGIFVVETLHIQAWELTKFGLCNSVISFFTRVISLLVYKLLFLRIKKRQSKHEKTKNRYVFLITGDFIVVTPIIILFYVLKGSPNSQDLLTSLSGILLIFELVFFMLIALESNKERQKTEKHMQEQSEQLKLMQMQMEYSESITEITHEMRQLRHDFNNHLSTIMQFLKSSDTESAINYIGQLNHVVEDAMDICVIDNPILRAVITDKKRKAKRANISFSTSISVSKFPLEDMELNSLFSNISDNAIEASEQVEETDKRIIDMEISRDTENIYIECTNSMKNKPELDSKKNIVTSKDDKAAHGYGLTFIEKLVHKYDGDMNIFYDETTFKISITLPDNGGKK